MRWRIIDPANTREAAEREAVIRKIDAWWKAFQAKTGDLSAFFAGKAKWDLADWMHRHFSAIHPNMMWEFGPAVQGSGQRLVITPESAHHLRPLAHAIRKRAPAINGWEFYEYRLPESLESTRFTVQGRVGCDPSDFKVKVSRGMQHRIDLEFTSPSLAAADQEQGSHAAFIAAETLLGEYVLNEWIGGISFTPGKTGGLKGMFGGKAMPLPHFLELDRLKDTVESVKGSIIDQLPPQPHYEWVNDDNPNVNWSVWKLKPEQADEYAEQRDLLVGRSVNPEMWKTAHTGELFSSKRFSRCGETFCYVKIDGAEGLGDGGFADKAEIEDALDAALRSDKLGCHIGGGTGIRYSYVDLALVDVMKGIEVVRRCLRAGNAPQRSWVQFFDSDWGAEWVGVYKDTPAPPMAWDTE
jgi:hypothetical protein